jgi:hypothetical protein
MLASIPHPSLHNKKRGSSSSFLRRGTCEFPTAFAFGRFVVLGGQDEARASKCDIQWGAVTVAVWKVDEGAPAPEVDDEILWCSTLLSLPKQGRARSLPGIARIYGVRRSKLRTVISGRTAEFFLECSGESRKIIETPAERQISDRLSPSSISEEIETNRF